MPDTAERAGDPALYEANGHGWIARRVAALQSAQSHRPDRADLAAFPTDTANRDRREMPRASPPAIHRRHHASVRISRNRNVIQ